MPYFLPPSVFTRVDSCQDALFKKENFKDEDDSTIVGLSRNRRFKHASYIPFSLAGPIPEKPQYQALQMLKFKLVTNDQFNLVKEVLFAQFQIYSKVNNEIFISFFLRIPKVF